MVEKNLTMTAWGLIFARLAVRIADIEFITHICICLCFLYQYLSGQNSTTLNVHHVQGASN